MVGVRKLRIKFGSHGDLKTLQIPVVINNCGNAERTKPSICEDVFDATNQSRKRRTKKLEEVEAKKIQKVEHSWRQCHVVLRLMREHQFGWVFDEPVDPVKLNIPDYFSVISKPMDLETIKSKLFKNLYRSQDGFVADVRLTFDNAMLYNPPGNTVHQMAKDLKDFFEVKWQALSKKRTSESKIEVTEVSKRQTCEVDCVRQRSCFEAATSSSESFPLAFSKPVEEETKKHTPAVRQLALTKKLRKKKLEQSLGFSLSPEISGKGTNKQNGTSTASCKCALCGRITCICLKSCNSSEKFPAIEVPRQRACTDSYNKTSSLTDCEAKNKSSSQATKSDAPSTCAEFESKTTVPLIRLPPEKDLRAAMIKARFAEVLKKSEHKNFLCKNNKADLTTLPKEKEQMDRTRPEGCVNSMNCDSSQLEAPSNDAISESELKTILPDIPLPPEKARRAAMIKGRFADVILKSKHRNTHGQNTNLDLIKIQKEKEEMERKQREEEERIEAEIKAKLTELKQKREKQRTELEKMEKTVKIENDSLTVEMEFVDRYGCNRKCLQSLGLVLKDERCEDEYLLEPSETTRGDDLEAGEVV